MTNEREPVLTRLARFGERHLRTDVTYLAKGGFWLTLGYGAQMLSGIILAVALANLVPREAYGTYQFIISMSAILGGLTLTGLGTALMRTVAQGATGTLRYAFATQLRWSIGVALASAAVAIYYLVNGNTQLASAFLIVGATSPFLSAFSLYRPYLEGRRLFRESVLMGAWRRPVPLIALLLAMLVTDDPVLLVLTYFVSHTLSMGLLYLRTVRKYPEPAERNDEMVGYSKHLSVMAFVGLVANNLDNIAVFHYLGAVPLAVYTLAQLPLTHTLKLFGLGGSLVFPKFAARDMGEIKAAMGHKFLVYLAVAALVVAVYIPLAPFVFGLLFPGYPEAVLVSQVLILAVLAKPFTLIAQAFAAHGMKKVQHFVQITVSAVKLTLLLVLIPLYGVWGAVAAVLGATLYWCIALAVLFRRV